MNVSETTTTALFVVGVAALVFLAWWKGKHTSGFGDAMTPGLNDPWANGNMQYILDMADRGKQGYNLRITLPDGTTSDGLIHPGRQVIPL